MATPTSAPKSSGSAPRRTPSLVTGARASRSTIALKMAMALSGALFIGYVLVHMYGNLKAFAGEDSFNGYAEHLRELGEPILPHSGLLWIIRVVLLGALVVHVASALVLWRRAQRARPVKYVVKKRTGATYASLMMRWGGISLLLFIVWHLLHFTLFQINPQGEAIEENPYRLVVAGFEVWWMTLIYLAAMLALGAHLHHGIWSSAQTLGLTGTARARLFWKRLGFTLALIISVGFSLVPLGVLFGVVS